MLPLACFYIEHQFLYNILLSAAIYPLNIGMAHFPPKRSIQHLGEPIRIYYNLRCQKQASVWFLSMT
jgi:hypothetical protein